MPAVKRDITRTEGSAWINDMPIHDVPDEVIARLEAHARRLGLSRTEHLHTSDSPVSTADLVRFADTFSDLGDPEVMSPAWQ
jgi:hypothetical protein